MVVKVEVEVREFNPEKDCLAVEEVERRCDVGPSGKMCLFTDLRGDPICRVRHSPSFLMLVRSPFLLLLLLLLLLLSIRNS